MKPATVKQLGLIKRMEDALDIHFEGFSIAEASDFISEHMEAYQDHIAFVFDMVHNENNY